MVFLLSGIVPVLFILGLLVRIPPPAVNAELPVDYTEPTGFTDPITQAASFPDFERMSFQVFGRPGQTTRVVRLTAEESVRSPVLLIYWSTNQNASNGQLLGNWMVNAPGLFELPAGSTNTRGWLVLFDLAKNEAVASVQL